MKKILKNEKGSMTVYVSVSILAFILILSGIFITSVSIRKNQLKTTVKIKEVYERDLAYKKEIYNKVVSKKNGVSIPKVTITVSSIAVFLNENVTATVIQEEQSGLALDKCRYVYNQISTPIGTDENLYTGGYLPKVENVFDLTNKSLGTFYLHTLTIDKNNNKVEGISSAISVISKDSNQYDKPNSEENPYYTYTVPANGIYKLQVWGASGGYRNDSSLAGRGGYTSGNIALQQGDSVYVYVGGSGNSVKQAVNNIYQGGYNGGGYRYGYPGGGGATDIRFISGRWDDRTSLLSRVIVAGGGGSDGGDSRYGYAGGGTYGGSSTQDGTAHSSSCGKGGAPTYSGSTSEPVVTKQATTGLQSDNYDYCGGFGFGGAGINIGSAYGGAGGGGWYGGTGVVPDSSSNARGGGGGSGFIYNESTVQYTPEGYSVLSKYYLTNTLTLDGDNSFESPTSEINEQGHLGDGYAKITPISLEKISSTTSTE